MGMFDEVRAMNISHKHFNQRHNDTTFQTKDLENDLSVYCVFNGVLYQEVDGSNGNLRHEHAIPSTYSGELNIYTSIKKDDIESWVEYDLHFDSGKLVDVTPYEVRVTKDARDLSTQRPAMPSNRVTVTISVSGCDRDKTNLFVSSLNDSKIDAIRNILDEPTATVVYPAIHKSIDLWSDDLRQTVRSVTSVVQTKDDFISACKEQAKIKAPNGDEIVVILDEGSIFHHDMPRQESAGHD